MTYDLKSAGHEEAVQERQVVATPNPQIEEFISFTQRLVREGVKDREVIVKEFNKFFGKQSPWHWETIEEVLRNDRLPKSIPESAKSQKNSSEDEPHHRIEAFLFPAVLPTLPEKVIKISQPYNHILPHTNLGTQPERIFVDSIPYEKRSFSFADIHTTSDTMVISTENNHPDVLIDFPRSLIVHLRSRPPSAPHFLQDTLHLNQNPLHLLRLEPKFKLAETDIRQNQALCAYIADVLYNCNNPYQLHDIYGPTPGPTIRRRILELAGVPEESPAENIPERNSFLGYRRTHFAGGR